MVIRDTDNVPGPQNESGELADDSMHTYTL